MTPILTDRGSGDTMLPIMFHIYILELKDKSYYVGSTSDLEDRMKEHKSKKVKSTKNKLPFELKYTEQYTTRSEAQSREYQIKKWKSRKAIERLINKTKINTAPSSNG